MPKRLLAFIRGSEDAYPGDYLVAIVAVVVIMLSIVAVMMRGLV
ncbi:hypothetical protein [Kangsaoukella pontilimi]|nr:hypothetical protein [Kangsaoukella pontilimi]